MVFLAAPVIRTVARMLFPSTRQPMICARFSVLNLFILTIMREHSDGKTGLLAWQAKPGCASWIGFPMRLMRHTPRWYSAPILVSLGVSAKWSARGLNPPPGRFQSPPVTPSAPHVWGQRPRGDSLANFSPRGLVFAATSRPRP